MSIVSGYITNWNSTAFVNGTTRLATSYTGGGVVVKPRLILLSSGVIVNYDGAGPSPTAPGKVSQEFIDSAGRAFLTTMESQKGVQATLSLYDSVAASTETVTAILIDVDDVTPVQGNRDKVWGLCTWRIVGDWT